MTSWHGTYMLLASCAQGPVFLCCLGNRPIALVFPDFDAEMFNYALVVFRVYHTSAGRCLQSRRLMVAVVVGAGLCGQWPMVLLGWFCIFSFIQNRELPLAIALGAAVSFSVGKFVIQRAQH